MYLQKLYNHFKPKSVTSTVNEPIRIGHSFGKKAIFAGDVPQSGGEFIHQWDTVTHYLNENDYDFTNCLMLGVAGGTAINSLRKYYPKIHVTGIEIDPVILEVALKNGLFQTDKKIKIKIADAIDWIRNDKNTYDLVIVDLFLGDKNVKESRNELFLRQVKSRLTAQGIVLYNCHYSKDRVGEYKMLETRLEKFFKHVEVVFEFRKNKVLLLEK